MALLEVTPHLNNWISANQGDAPWFEEVEFGKDYASHINKDEGPVYELHRFIWVKPSSPYIKINSDASISTRGVGCGYIMRDEEGCVIFGEAVNYNELKTVVEAELVAIYLACLKAQDFGIKFVWLESDSLVAVNLINNVHGTTPGEYKSILNQIYIVLASFEGWTVTHVWREANGVADTLAKMGGAGNEFIFTTDDVPANILSLVVDDASGKLYTRVKTQRKLPKHHVY
ncbi:uncharacterized protein LOC120265234 [Dioscorea cayenensis subsp. rotundata]|uniref:Uncharacterized protein LOC120265234 n=1 Tax=Dioscorea cayennensis subsp. rotundata TaxID=55577 RepID=A0AB40BNS1_DIOCR|nr:uncharacterized protein LOC120265234 [Dioscorea cayenensis subsp. rotundata]